MRKVLTFFDLKGTRKGDVDTDAHECAYASTKQGGNNSATVMEIVNGERNQNHGRALGRSFNKYNTKDGEDFYVVLWDDEDENGNSVPIDILYPSIPLIKKVLEEQNQQMERSSPKQQPQQWPVLNPGGVNQPKQEHHDPSPQLPNPKTVTKWLVIGIVSYEIAKWGSAIIFAPVTGGVTLAAASLTP